MVLQKPHSADDAIRMNKSYEFTFIRIRIGSLYSRRRVSRVHWWSLPLRVLAVYTSRPYIFWVINAHAMTVEWLSRLLHRLLALLVPHANKRHESEHKLVDISFS